MLTISGGLISETSASTCHAMAIGETTLPAQSGHLIYLQGEFLQLHNIIASTSPDFQDVTLISVRASQLSPNGEWLASLEYDGTTSISDVIVTRDIYGEVIFATRPEQQGLNDITWLGNEEILTIVVQYPGDRWAYSIIDPFTRQVRFVYPRTFLWTLQPDYDLTPLFPDTLPGGVQSFSPDGQYLYATGTSMLYDLQTAEKLDLENVQGDVWAYSSDQLIFLDPDSQFVAGESIAVLVYDISTDNVRQIATVSIAEADRIGIYPNSWSPDEQFLALTYWFRDTPFSHRTEILDLDTGNVINACFRGTGEWHHHFDFAWSRDSRYLALYGALEGETDQETGNVYIYDTLENQIYEVYEGFADIVGWAVNPENE
jgi:WD40 repeat protein